MASTYEGVSDQNYIKLNKIIFFAESEPKTEPDADCHDDPKIGVLFNNIFSLYLHPHLLLVISTYLLATVVLIGFNVVALLYMCIPP